jgi:hypothetical protein
MYTKMHIKRNQNILGIKVHKTWMIWLADRGVIVHHLYILIYIHYSVLFIFY